jgi:hypothetical protein
MWQISTYKQVCRYTAHASNMMHKDAKAWKFHKNKQKPLLHCSKRIKHTTDITLAANSVETGTSFVVNACNDWILRIVEAVKCLFTSEISSVMICHALKTEEIEFLHSYEEWC